MEPKDTIQEIDLKRIITEEEMKLLVKAEQAQTLDFGGHSDYLANYNGATYVFRESITKNKYYERLTK